jgi:2-hydroxychromene-2-carboxylate isomerase
VAEVTIPRVVGQPVFYYDLGDPACYLMAEQIMGALPAVPEWEPVLGSGLGAMGVAANRDQIEALAAALGLQLLRWPEPWPPDTRMAMLAATYAKRIGRGVAFSLAAFRQAFAGGRDLGDENTVLIAGAACEMHPSALLKGIALRSVSEALAGATARAARAGVGAVPAVQVGDELFEGVDGLERAVLALAR